MKPYVAFFDLNKTILEADGELHLLWFLYKKTLFSLIKFLNGIFIAILYGIRIYNGEKVIIKFVNLLKDIPENSLNKITIELFDEVLKKKIRPKAIDTINFHKQNGGKTVLLSSSLFNICNIIQKNLNMDDSLCTNFEVIDATLTGNTIGKCCYEQEKLNQAIQYCTKNNFLISEAFFYADSIGDALALKGVGNPVCVTPSKELIKIAQMESWEIEKW